MKLLHIALIVGCIGVAIATPVVIGGKAKSLGAKECTWGPSYWCSNITNSKSCNAVAHCIQSVWEKQRYPEDNDSICKICLDMVKQARDQLLSNETQDELRQVFEGSCNLIPIKIVRKECDKLADDFIPELIDMLASQMEPNTVCSVAGLCNNANIDKMLAAGLSDGIPTPAVVDGQLSCDSCDTIATEIEQKFGEQNRDDVLENFLEACGRTSSMADACSNIVITYFNDIYAHLQNNLKSKNICHMSGVCAANFHVHEDRELEIRPMSGVGVVSVNEDIPCDLCMQLVKHLRDVLIANTTELEFKEVLEGFCNQTQGFRKECNSIVEEYYDVIYQTLVHHLDEQGACFMIGICKKGISNGKGHIMPLLPSKTAEMVPPRLILGADEPELSAVEINNAQLPIDVLMGAPNSLQLVNNGESCTICEYFFHFLQEELASPKTEEEIKELVGSSCDKMPRVGGQCHAFVDMYGDAIIALLIQNINPAQVCPMLKLCPSIQIDSEVFSPIPVEINKNNNKPGCPLCLFAVTEAIAQIKSDKSKQNIDNVLKGLCSHVPSKIRNECEDFVDTYTSELVEMIASDFTPVQICTYCKLCVENKTDFESSLQLERDGETVDDIKMESGENDILTNEIPDNTINGNYIETFGNPNLCGLCVSVLKDVNKHLDKDKSVSNVNAALDHACDSQKKLRKICSDLIETNRKAIVADIMNDETPKQICRTLGSCAKVLESQEPTHVYDQQPADDLEIDEALTVSIVARPADLMAPTVGDLPQCVICEFLMSKLEEQLKDKTSQDEIKKAVESICEIMPNSISKECHQFVDQYSNLIITLLATMPPKEICSQMMLCQINNEKISEHFLETSQYPQSAPTECSICIAVIKDVEKNVVNNRSEEQIRAALAHACDSVKRIKDVCKKFVHDHEDKIIEEIKNNLSPNQICRDLALCSTEYFFEFADIYDDQSALVPEFDIDESYPSNVHIETNIELGETPQCVLCETIMKQLENELKDKKTQEEIKAAVEGVCKVMPKNLSAQCNKFIDEYANLIITLVATMPPKAVCTQLQLCHINLEKSKMEVVECAVCQGAVDALEYVLKDKSVDTEIVELLEKACNKLPGKYYKKCDEMVQIYGISLINIITAERPETACKEIGMCYPGEQSGIIRLQDDVEEVPVTEEPAVTAKASLVGLSECTWGPSYWCSNSENAKKCNVPEDYCVSYNKKLGQN